MGWMHRAALLVGVSLIGGRSALASGELSYQPVALSGEAAPGSNASFLRFSNPVINATGQVAFQANLTGLTTNVVPHGVWVGSQSSLRLLALAGAEAPGTGGAKFQTPGWPIVLTSDGRALFYGGLIGGPGVTFDNDFGIWAGAPAAVGLIARRGEPAPGLPAGVNLSLVFANPHPSGLMGFSASLSGPEANPAGDSAAWVGEMGPVGALQLIGRNGDAAPGLPGFHFNSLGTPAVNASGEIALSGSAAPAPGAGSVSGIWAGVAGDLHLVAATGAPALGTAGRVFESFTPPRLSNANHIAFRGSLVADSDEQRLSHVGMWTGPATAAGIGQIALEGQPAPGFGEGVVFRGSAPGDEITYDAFANPVLGGNGAVAFAGTVFGDGVDFDHNDGVWVWRPSAGAGGGPAADSLMLVAREGEHPPGTPDGTRFAGVLVDDDLQAAFESPLINSAGQIAFEALTTGPLGQFGRGIWVTDSAGALHLLAHTGQELMIGPGDVREIELLKLNAGSSSEDGQLSAFNDEGQVAFAVRFADGSEGVFVAAVVPEPASVFCILAGLGVVKLRRCRRG